MKKYLLVFGLLLLGPAIHSEDYLQYGPIQITSTAINSGILAAPRFFMFAPQSGNLRPCMTSFEVSATSFSVTPFFTILDGGTTMYQLDFTTSPVSKIWPPEIPLCGSPGTTTYIYVSTGHFKVNASGYYKK